MGARLAMGPWSNRLGNAVQTTNNNPKTQAALIMVVDDDPMFRRDICGFLEDEGFRTVAAWNGREAFGLLLASSETPRLIILDLVMDSIDGREFRRRQREHAHYSKVPVIVVSGAPDAETIARELGVAGHLTKPLDADALLDEVHRVLS